MTERLSLHECPIVLHLLAGPAIPVNGRTALTEEIAFEALRQIASGNPEWAPFVEGASRLADDKQAWGVAATHDGTVVRRLTFGGGANDDGRETTIPILTGRFDRGFFTTEVEYWVRDLLPPTPSSRPEPADIAAAIEVFFTLWTQFAADATLTPDDRRSGDALATMANEVAKCDDPPKGVLREAFSWFAGKFETFADEFARSAGKTAGASLGTSLGVGLGATATGQLPHLIQAIDAVRNLLH